MSARLQETEVFRLTKAVVGKSETFPGRTYPLPAGTLGAVLLDHGKRYEVEFVIVPPYKGWRGIETFDTVEMVLDDSMVEVVH